MPHSFWPPLPCSRQAGRENQYLGVIAGYSPKHFWCQHRNWAPRGGETRGVPRGTGKTSAGFSKGADLGIIRTPFPLVDSWPFWRGETKYPTPSVERMYVEKVRRVPLGRMQYFWPQAASAARPFTSDLVASASRRNSLLPANGEGSKAQGTPGSGGGRQRVSAPVGGTGPPGQGPLDPGVVDGAPCCPKAQRPLAVLNLNPASHPIQHL